MLNLLIEMTERGYIPDSLLRIGIRKLCRERLQSLFGANASLTISANTPHGVVATLIIPIESESR